MNTQNSNPKCPNCHIPMKLIPAGISKKTGKHYKAFYSCPNCGYTLNIPDDIADKIVVNNVTNTKSRDERIEQLHNEKIQNVLWTSAMGRAIDIVSRHPAFANLSENEIWKKIIFYRDLIYKEYTGQVKTEVSFEDDNNDNIDINYEQ